MNYLIPMLLVISCKILSQTTGSKTVNFTLPIVSLMDVEPNGTITLNYAVPGEAGRPVSAPSVDTSKWINYTSAIASGGIARRITASINQLLSGIDIKVQAGTSTTGAGTLGTPSGQITLSTTAQTLISGIGGAFTGSGTYNGHRLSIILSTNTYADLLAGANTPIVITYTITE